MKNFVQSGDVLTVAAPTGGVSSGDVVLVNKLLGVAAYDAAQGDPVEVKVEGVFTVPCATADDIAIGALLYWDAADAEFNVSASGNTKAGYAVTAAGVGVVSVDIKLTPGVG